MFYLLGQDVLPSEHKEISDCSIWYLSHMIKINNIRGAVWLSG